MTPEQKLEQAVRNVGGGGSKDLSALAAAARAELGASPKARAWWVDGLFVLGLNVLMGVAGAMLLDWNDEQHHSAMTKYGVASLWFVFMAIASVLWLRPGSVKQRWMLGGGFVAVTLAMLFALSGFDPGGAFMNGMWCAFAECKIAIVPVAVVVLLSTRFAAQTSHLVIGTLAAASGGAVALHFHCPNGTLSHVAVFHVLPALLLAALAIGARAMWRPKSFVP
ncbi:MAG: hypothetical protein QM817_40260 [Archangium sp.]